MELRTYLRILRAHWLGLIVLVVVGVVSAFGWTLLQPKVYSADASGIVAPVRTELSGNDAGSALVAENLAKAKVGSYLDLGSWRAVAEHAIAELGLTSSPESLVNRVQVSNPTDTVNIRVVASASSPEGARDLAQAWIRAMATEVENLETSGGVSLATVQLVPGDTARLPSSPSSPNVRIALALGALAGLVLGIAYAVLRYTLDRRIRSADAVEKETGLSVVGTIPDEKSFTADNRLLPVDGISSGSHADLFGVSEAMRELRTNLQFMDVDNPPRIIVVTSPLPGDGKSTTSANLAITLAANGSKVVLIDGDLRRPMVATIFRLVDGVGVTDVLAGRATVEDVAQRVGRKGNLLVLGAGKLPPNPSEVLGSERMKNLLRTLAKDYTVIVDAPPLIPVTDAAVLSHSADGAIIITSVGKTTFEALTKALQNLERAGSRALGVVLNRVPRKGRGGYHDYRYAGDYYRSKGGEDGFDIDLTEDTAGTMVSAGAPGAASTPSPSSATRPASGVTGSPAATGTATPTVVATDSTRRSRRSKR
ncbi:Tyrosine-protein kinase YwqD [Microbacterium lemovicicum]|uniref:non-specific protein-tyrosine kinase n=1 Tax=Microbacterium lemovicicum TaxID=1072463 RepID=A0A3Q9IY80_9MICO|nr:polysaccharide biosynthesis tyrosine autokinase [Microbacterium lemovicicum]AZS35911.1 Tyrosine-protein kinase YwqD [Microbacterium lemovicicum]